MADRTDKLLRNLKTKRIKGKRNKISFPSHVGNHTAGYTHEPVIDKAIANKKYVDDSIVSYDQSLNTTDDVDFASVRTTGSVWSDQTLRTNTIQTQSNGTNLSLNTLTTGDFTFNNSVSGNIATIDDSGNASFDGTLSIGGHLINFLDLADTPDSLSGQGNKMLIVNAGSTAIAFQPQPVIITDHGTLTGLTDDDHTDYKRLLGRTDEDEKVQGVFEKEKGTITPVRLIQSADGTTTEDDSFVIMAGFASNRTLNLHDVSGLGTTKSFTLFIIKNGAANSLIIDPYGAATIDGGATKTITTNLHCVRIMCYNGNWFTVTDNQ
jgi:hypothetical protein